MTMLLFIVLLLFLFILLLLIAFFIVQIIAIFSTYAPFVSIPDGLENEIIEYLGLNENSVLYDLGCGDGRVLRNAVQKYPKIKAVGVDIAVFPYLVAKFNTRKYENIQIKREDILVTNKKDATHIFMYLSPAVTNIMSSIEAQCKPGTIVMSCDFEITSMIPISTVTTKNTSSKTRGKKLFVYQL